MSEPQPRSVSPSESSPYRSPAFVAEHREGSPMSVPYDGQAHMTLVLSSAISRARIRVDPRASALVRIETGGGTAPRTRVSDDEIAISWRWSATDWLDAVFGAGREEVDIALHPEVSWSLVVRGGLSAMRADLSRGKVSSVDVRGGCSDVDLALPRVESAVPVRISGGASCVRIVRPEGVAVSVSVRGGASSLRVDEQSFAQLGGDVRLTSGDASARYDVEVQGGASDVDVVCARR